MKRSKNNMISTAVGVTAGVAVGIAANSAIPQGQSMIGNLAKIALGVFLAAKKRTNTTYLTGGLGLAAEGASELIAQYTSGSPDSYQAPKLFGFPGVYTSPGYYPYTLNGIGATGDAGVTEQMRY